MTTLAIYHLKGGVGKTSTTVNLGYLFSKKGYRTLIWDLDPQGGLTTYLNITTSLKKNAKKLWKEDISLGDAIIDTEYENLSIIPADISARQADIFINEGKQQKKKLKNILQEVDNEFDFVLLDCPPGISLLHDNIFIAADLLIIPNIPSPLSIAAFEKIKNYFMEKELDSTKIKSFFNMVDTRKNIHKEIISGYKDDLSFLNTNIPYLSDIEKMGIKNKPLEIFAPRGTAAKNFKKLFEEIFQDLQGVETNAK